MRLTRRAVLLSSGLILCAPVLRAGGAVETWQGARTHGGKSQAIVLRLERTSGTETAIVDLPEFGALGIPAARFSRADGQFHFELVGDETTTVFDGRAAADAADGTWTDGVRAGEFHLRRAAEVARGREEALSFQSDGLRLAGTLVRPAGEGRTPAIVFVHGAGPETRNASRFLAQFFAARGIASLIYDKRGAGESAGDWRHASLADLAGDVVAAVSYLKSRPEIDASRIGLMGTSQGGWVAPMAAVRSSDVRFVILKSAPGVTPEEQELARIEMTMRAGGETAADIAQALALYRQLIAYARTGKDWDALSSALAAVRGKRWNVFGEVARDWWFLDWIRMCFGHDPIPVLEEMTQPVLVVFGGQDVDVPVRRSLEQMLPALGAAQKSAAIQVYPAAGHDLRVEPTAGEPWDFPHFAPGYLDLLASWVELQVRQR
jgi:pimeloyl-ACP methyl ester carboxylesterase